MSTLLDFTGEVVGVDLAKIKQAFAILTESGLNETTVKNMSYSMGYSKCAECERVFQDADFAELRLPGWNPPYDQNMKVRKREKFRLVERPLTWERQRQAVDSLIGETWDRSKHYCEHCLVPAIESKLDRVVALLQGNRKVQTYFLHGVKDSILIMVKSEEKYGRNAPDNDLYEGFVALVNGLMQRIPSEGNAVAYRYLIESARLLRMI